MASIINAATSGGLVTSADTSGILQLQTASTTAVTVNASQNVGIGTSSPSNKLEVKGGNGNQLTLDNAGEAYTQMTFKSNGTNRAAIWATAAELGLYTYSTQSLIFYTNTTERARIDSSGNLLVGTTTSSGARLVVGGTTSGSLAGTRNTLHIRNSSSSSNQSNTIVFGSAGQETSCIILNDVNANGTTINQLNIQAGTTGGVYLANGGTSWTSSSDERVKDIIEPITNAATKVATLRAVIGKYKTDSEQVRRSFLIAQDVQAVLPEAVTVGTDEINTLGLSYTDTIPLLVAAIQEQQTLIQSLKARLDAANL